MLIAVALGLLAGAADMVGGWCALRFSLSRESMDDLLALGAGFVLGSAFFTMLPGAIESTDGPLFVAIGYLTMFCLRRLLGPCHVDGRVGREAAGAALLGVALHSLFDGAALGMALQMGDRPALAALLALLLHKIPEGFSIAVVMLSAFERSWAATVAVVVVGLASVIGTLAAVTWASLLHTNHGALAGVAAGMFLYIGCSDMAPAVGRGRPLWLAVGGVALLFALTGGTHVHG